MNKVKTLHQIKIWRLTLLPAVALATCTVWAGTPESYRKLWRDPATNERIERNVEKYRKGDATIEVLDQNGKPLSGAKIVLRQLGHEFLFGCNAFVLGQLEPPEHERRYEDSFVKLFNFSTVPFYWEGTEPTRGELRYEEKGARDIWRRPPPERFLSWAATHGITLKGHPLLWHSYNPPWLPKDAVELRALYQKRFREIASRFSGKVTIWDVVNESQVCPKSYPLFTEDRAYVGWAFREVAPLFPAQTALMINEVTRYNYLRAEKNPYFTQVKSLLAQGAPVRGIGFQFHFFQRKSLDTFLAGQNSDPGGLLTLYEKFGECDLPLFITEITIGSSGESGEELQAEVVRDLYRLWFAVPGMAGITWWNLGDGTAVKSAARNENDVQGGLLDNGFRPKAAYRALDQLINRAWKTRVELQTDERGQARFRGFFGKYEVAVSSGVIARRFEIQHRRLELRNHPLVLKP